MLLIQPRDDDLDNNLGRGSTVRAAIVSAVEVMLVDRLCSREAVSSNRELDRLEDRTLAGIVVTKQDGGAAEIEIGSSYSAEILNLNANDTHRSPQNAIDDCGSAAGSTSQEGFHFAVLEKIEDLRFGLIKRLEAQFPPCAVHA